MSKEEGFVNRIKGFEKLEQEGPVSKIESGELPVKVRKSIENRLRVRQKKIDDAFSLIKKIDNLETFQESFGASVENILSLLDEQIAILESQSNGSVSSEEYHRKKQEIESKSQDVVRDVLVNKANIKSAISHFLGSNENAEKDLLEDDKYDDSNTDEKMADELIAGAIRDPETSQRISSRIEKEVREWRDRIDKRKEVKSENERDIYTFEEINNLEELEIFLRNSSNIEIEASGDGKFGRWYKGNELSSMLSQRFSEFRKAKNEGKLDNKKVALFVSAFRNQEFKDALKRGLIKEGLLDEVKAKEKSKDEGNEKITEKGDKDVSSDQSEKTIEDVSAKMENYFSDISTEDKFYERLREIPLLKGFDESSRSLIEQAERIIREKMAYFDNEGNFSAVLHKRDPQQMKRSEESNFVASLPKGLRSVVERILESKRENIKVETESQSKISEENEIDLDVNETEALKAFSKTRKVQSDENLSKGENLEDTSTNTEASPDFDLDKMLNEKKDVVEFLAKFPDSEKVMESGNMAEIEKRVKVFEDLEKVSGDIRGMWKEEIEGAVGIELASEDLVCVDKFLNLKAIENPDYIIKLAEENRKLKEAEIISERLKKEIEDLRKESVPDKLKDLKSWESTLKSAYKTTGKFGFAYLDTVVGFIADKLIGKGEESEDKASLEARKLIKRAGKDLTREVLSKELEAVQKDIEQREKTLQSIEEFSALNSEAKKQFSEIRKMILREMVPVEELKEIAKKKTLGVIKALMGDSKVTIESLKRAEIYFDDVREISKISSGDVGIDYLEDFDIEKWQKEMDQKFEDVMRVRLNQEIDKITLGQKPIVKVEKVINDILSEETLGSKKGKEIKVFVNKVLKESLSKIKGDSTSDRAKRIILVRLISKTSK